MTEYKKKDTDKVPVLSLYQAEGDQDAKRPYLSVLTGKRTGQRFPLEHELSIGSGADTDIQLDGDGIEDHHCRVTADDPGVVRIVDLDTDCGTYVNNAQIDGSSALENGDRILLGPGVLLQLSYQDPLDEQFERALRESALQDVLTGLYNERYLTDRLNAEVHFALRHETALSLCLLDLDHFHQVNNSHGQGLGDQILKAVANLIKRDGHPEDVYAHLTGGTFAVIALRPVREAGALAEILRGRLADHSFVGADFNITLTASFGISGLPHPGLSSSESLLAASRKALEEAKLAGRNRCVVYEG